MNSLRQKSSNNKSSINLYDAIANDDLEGMIYLYCLCTKQSLQLLNGRNIDNRRDDVHQPTDMSGLMTDAHQGIQEVLSFYVVFAIYFIDVIQLKLMRFFNWLFIVGSQAAEEKRDEMSSKTSSTGSLNSPVVDRLIKELDNLLNTRLQQSSIVGGRDRRSNVENNHELPTNTSLETTEETSDIIRLGNRERMNGDVRNIPFLPPLFGLLNHRSINASAAMISNSLYPTNVNDIDSYLFEHAKVLSNARPHVSFVVAGNVEKACSKTLSHTRQDPTTTTPLFDGAVANATPIGYDSTGGGIGTALHLACAIDSPLALAILLVMGANASCRHTAFRRLMIHEAACCDSPKCLKLLLELCGEYCNQLQELHIPIGNLNYRPIWSKERMHAHMSKGGTTMPSDRRGTRTTPHEASQQSEFIKVLHLCLEFIQKVEAGKLDDYNAALDLLRVVSVSDMNKYIIASTCRIDFNNMMNDCDGHGNTALHWAAFKNSTACARILLGYKANPNAVASTSGWTPLHDAAYSDSCDTLSLLISAGANVNAKANSGATPLCFAAQEDAPNATRILLEAGADPTLRCCEDHVSCPFSGRSNTTSENGFGRSHQQLNRFSGYTPLHYCAHYNAQHSARILLEYHSKVLLPRNTSLLEISDLNDKLPIHIAVARGSSIVLRELLHYGARIETTGAMSSKHLDKGNDDDSTSSMTSIHTSHSEEEDEEDVLMDEHEQQQQQQTTLSPSPTATMVTPVSSPVLRSMIPTQPIDSPKPWNCISQRSIDECKMLIQEVEMNWSPERHSIFHPRDRAAVLELLRVGKHLEQEGTGLFLELWPLVLSFCGRGWFEPDEKKKQVHRHAGS